MRISYYNSYKLQKPQKSMKNQIKNWYRNANKSISAFIEKNKRLAKNVGLAGLIGIGSLMSLKANAVGVDVFFIDTPNCSLKVYRAPSGGSIDTLYAKTNSRGHGGIETNNFDPQSQIGDTLYIIGGWNLGKNAKTIQIVKASGNSSYDLNLDKFTGCIKDVIDTSKVNASLKAIYSLNGVAPCTTDIDTGIDQHWKFNYDVHVPFSKTDATQGKSGNIDLVKVLADTTWKTSIPFTVDRTKFDAQLISDTTYFSFEKIVNDKTPPTISNATQWPDTTFTGPYNVQWTRTDPAGISADNLTYKINQGSEIKAPADSVVGDTAYATIDTIVAPDDSVFYEVKSVDASINQNEACWPDSGFYGFKAKGIGIDENTQARREAKIAPNPFLNGTIIYNKGKFNVTLYDLAGRQVEKVSGKDRAEIGYSLPAGIYLARVYRQNGSTEVKIIKIK